VAVVSELCLGVDRQFQSVGARSSSAALSLAVLLRLVFAAASSSGVGFACPAELQVYHILRYFRLATRGEPGADPDYLHIICKAVLARLEIYLFWTGTS
jgi:hypothetical protein